MTVTIYRLCVDGDMQNITIPEMHHNNLSSGSG